MGSVFLESVDDYLGPSQACINPLFSSSEALKVDNTDDKNTPSEEVLPTESSSFEKTRKVRRKRTPLHVSPQESSPLRQQTATGSSEKKATVSVADCLACSGCITSAEAVLVTQHSISTLRREVLQNDNVVFTISNAAISDLFRVLCLDPGGDSVKQDFVTESAAKETTGKIPKRQMILETFQKLTSFLHTHFRAQLLLDGQIPLQISLFASAVEFCHSFCTTYREDAVQTDGLEYEKKSGHSEEEELDWMVPSVALSATRTRYLSTVPVIVDHGVGPDLRHHPLPMLASSCPGFVCYVEKTFASVIPNLCTVKSCMATSGTLLKHNRQSPVYHVAIMPCHDKKLEAGRKDLAWQHSTPSTKDADGGEETLVPDVDLVLTTSEVMTALAEQAAAEGETVREYFHGLPLAPASTNASECFDLVTKGPHFLAHASRFPHNIAVTSVGHYMNGSGGYAEYIFRFAARKLFGHVISDEETLPWKRVASLQGARIQRRKKEHSDLWEVMLYKHSNGTYSCHSTTSDEESVLRFAIAYGFKNIQLVLQRLSNKKLEYHYVEVMACPSGCLNGGGQISVGQEKKKETLTEMRERVHKNQSVMDPVYSMPDYCWDESSEMMRKMLHTRFHVVPKLELFTGAVAGVALNDTKW